MKQFNLEEHAPNLFLIGAAKTGSSALHNYLNCHPDIHMSAEKEPCFFVDSAELDAFWPVRAHDPVSYSAAAYCAMFANGRGARYRGESSTLYSMAPTLSGVPERIRAASPDARIIYLVREPVDRAIKQYWQQYKEFQERRPLDAAFAGACLYKDCSDYALQVRPYVDAFGADRVLIVASEDLRHRRTDTLADIFEWLGLPNVTLSEEQLRERHVSPSDSRRQRFPLVREIRDSRAWRKARTLLPDRVVNALRAAGTVHFEKTEVDETQVRRDLAHYFRERLPAFEKIAGRRFESWQSSIAAELT